MDANSAVCPMLLCAPAGKGKGKRKKGGKAAASNKKRQKTSLAAMAAKGEAAAAAAASAHSVAGSLAEKQKVGSFACAVQAAQDSQSSVHMRRCCQCFTSL